LLDPRHRRVERAGREIVLTPKEFAVSEYLLRHQNEVISRISKPAALLAKKVLNSRESASQKPTFTFIRGVSKFLPVLDGFLPLKILEFVSDFGALPDTTGLLCLE
jgi:hypothetical protein